MTTPPLTRRAALSFAGLMVAGPLVLTACGKSDDAAPTADVGSPAAVTSIDGRQVSLPEIGRAHV